MKRLKAFVTCTFVLSALFLMPQSSNADQVSDYLSSCVLETGNFDVCKKHLNSMLFTKCYVRVFARLTRPASIELCDTNIELNEQYIHCATTIAGISTEYSDSKLYCSKFSMYNESTTCLTTLFAKYNGTETLRQCFGIMSEKVRLLLPSINLQAINEAIQLPMDSVLMIENEIDLPFKGCGTINVDSKAKQCQVCRKVESRNDITLVHDSVSPRTLMIGSLEVLSQGRELVIQIANDPDKISHIRCRNSKEQIPVLERKDLAPYLKDNGIKLIVPPPIRK